MNVLITGAAGGLGRAMAVECAKRGYRLYLTDVNPEGLKQIQTGLQRQFGAAVEAIACDLTKPAGIDDLFLAWNGVPFDMLLNIAGLDYEGGFLSRNQEQVVKIVALNDEGTLRMTHAALQRRRADAPFTVVFVSSLASMFPMPLKATYAASKRFLLDFAVSLRQELKEQNVHVLALCPGGMVTNDTVAQAIWAQGFWGDATTNSLEVLVRKTLDKALKGDAVYVPGAINKTLAFLGRCIPRRIVAAVVYQRWTAAQKKWMTAA